MLIRSKNYGTVLDDIFFNRILVIRTKSIIAKLGLIIINLKWFLRYC